MNIRYEVIDLTERHGYIVYRFPLEYNFTLEEMLPIFMELNSGRFALTYNADGIPQTIDFWVPPNLGDTK